MYRCSIMLPRTDSNHGWSSIRVLHINIYASDYTTKQSFYFINLFQPSFFHLFQNHTSHPQQLKRHFILVLSLRIYQFHNHLVNYASRLLADRQLKHPLQPSQHLFIFALRNRFFMLHLLSWLTPKLNQVHQQVFQLLHASNV